MLAAFAYARMGWPVFPLRRDDKRPLTEHGHEDATDDPAIIKGWWDRWPDANIGIPTGLRTGFDVLDCDIPKEGETFQSGRATLAAWEREHGAIQTLMAETGGGGLHLFFKHDPRIRNSAKRMEGIDVRGEGGYVVVAPSVHKSGKTYRWAHGMKPGDFPMSDWPATLIGPFLPRGSEEADAPDGVLRTPKPLPEASGGDRYGIKTLGYIYDELAACPAGGRDDKRNRLAFRLGRLVAAGRILREDAIEALCAACATNGLLEDLGESQIRKRNAAGVDAGIKAGPAVVKPARGAPAPSGTGAVVGVSAEGVVVPTPADETQTDVGNGKRLVRLFGANMRWCQALGWVVWDGRSWTRDRTGQVDRYAKESARLMRIEAEAIRDDAERKAARKHALASEKMDRIRSAIEGARTEPGMAIRAEEFDAHPHLMAVENGTLDVLHGTLRESRREDLLTKRSPVVFDEDARCPRWEWFLNWAMKENGALTNFLQLAFGYSMTGFTGEQCLFLLHGGGGNGKSTFLKATTYVMGEHASNADFTTFLQRPGTGPRPDLARLAGARYVTAVEPDQGAKFSESVLKAITGGDLLTARFLYAEEFQFLPQLKLWLSANHKPRITGTDHAIWRRIRLIPWLNEVVKKDPSLDADLRAEAPGILNWALDGARAWAETRALTIPEAVQGATDAYRHEEDRIADFLEDCCDVGPEHHVKAADLYLAYKKWAESGGEFVQSQTRFGRSMSERGFETKKIQGMKWRDGIRIRGG